MNYFPKILVVVVLMFRNLISLLRFLSNYLVFRTRNQYLVSNIIAETAFPPTLLKLQAITHFSTAIAIIYLQHSAFTYLIHLTIIFFHLFQKISRKDLLILASNCIIFIATTATIM